MPDDINMDETEERTSKLKGKLLETVSWKDEKGEKGGA